MALTDKEDTNLEQCYHELFEKVIELQSRYDGMAVAGTMMAQALRIYKSTLSEEDFKRMVESIVNSTDRIKPYEKPRIH